MPARVLHLCLQVGQSHAPRFAFVVSVQLLFALTFGLLSASIRAVHGFGDPGETLPADRADVPAATPERR